MKPEKIKRDFDIEVNKAFELIESLEDHLNNKIKIQDRDNQNVQHLKGIKKANKLLMMIAELLTTNKSNKY